MQLKFDEQERHPALPEGNLTWWIRSAQSALFKNFLAVRGAKATHTPPIQIFTSRNMAAFFVISREFIFWQNAPQKPFSTSNAAPPHHSSSPLRFACKILFTTFISKSISGALRNYFTRLKPFFRMASSHNFWCRSLSSFVSSIIFPIVEIWPIVSPVFGSYVSMSPSFAYLIPMLSFAIL